MEDEKSIWGPAREESDAKPEKIGIKHDWKLNEEPNLENIHPEDIIERCEHCGEDKDDCDCYCPCGCGEWAEDSGWCSECESHSHGDCECFS